MRRGRTIALGMVVLLLGCMSVQADESASLGLVPMPSHVAVKSGALQLTNGAAIVVDKDAPDALAVAKLLAERINQSTGLGLVVKPSDGLTKGAIVLTTKNANAALGPEGYALDVSPEGAVISATAGPGLFYGTQTLLQLLPPQVFSPKKVEASVAWSIPAVRIEDKPRFRWRGLMLDVSRHFFTKDEIKNYIDLMAQHKLNTFHWHLVDDQGWRIEIKRYPKLTEIGAWRTGIGFGLKPEDTTAYGPDGRYGGYYTQDDIREVVAYAKQRYVTIVPEIEMPGHSVAALTAYPELSCTGGPYNIDVQLENTCGVYCAGNDAAFDFLDGVLAEVIDLFPGKYIHIGGDEVRKDNWKKCAKCQARIRAEGLKDEEQLQDYFVRRIEKFLTAHGRTLIGWEEVISGAKEPGAAGMSWHGNGVAGALRVANAGHDVVMTPHENSYFNFYQSKTGEPKTYDYFLPLKRVYLFEPIPSKLTADKKARVIGAGGCLWAEYLPNYAASQYMTYPRACAMAEVTWTDSKLKDWDEFQTRLARHLPRLKYQAVNYRQPRPTDAAEADDGPKM